MIGGTDRKTSMDWQPSRDEAIALLKGGLGKALEIDPSNQLAKIGFGVLGVTP